MTKGGWLLLGAAFAGLAGATGPEQALRAVCGADLQGLLADHELGDGAHYAYQIHRDGRLTGAEMGKKLAGTWKATARQLCWTAAKPAGKEECYEVRQHGREIQLFRDGYEALSGSLTPLEPHPSNEVKP